MVRDPPFVIIGNSANSARTYYCMSRPFETLLGEITNA